MTGKEVFDRAMRLLNYTNAYGELHGTQTAEIGKRAVALVNQIYADISFSENTAVDFKPIESINEELKISARSASDVMPYGVAMLFAQSENDGDSQQLYAMLYNQKRTAIPKAPVSINDVLPVPQG